jgi:hypothetical protein
MSIGSRTKKKLRIEKQDEASSRRDAYYQIGMPKVLQRRKILPQPFDILHFF